MRIIAGRFGGRRLVAPRGRDTRPTSDRVREALFSALGDVGGARVLDLYAGTGALGLEALSRGAARATFVEDAREALATIRRNVDALGVGGEVEVVAQPVRRAALAVAGPFDLVLADPPYAALADVAPALADLGARGAIAAAARVVIEHASRDAAPLVPGAVARPSRRYGDTSVTIYDIAEPAASPQGL